MGVDALHSERSYDLALTTRFDSWADLEAYRSHPIHVEVREYVRATAESTIVVDYESAP